MAELATLRCYNHAWREAAARCPECHRYYCRECVTEHQDRVICAACLRRQVRSASSRRAPLAAAGRLSQCLAGILVAWIFFYALGRGLIELPTAFHEGTIWKARFWETE